MPEKSPAPIENQAHQAGEVTLNQLVINSHFGCGFTRAFSPVRRRRKCQGLAEALWLFAIEDRCFSQSWLINGLFVCCTKPKLKKRRSKLSAAFLLRLFNLEEHLFALAEDYLVCQIDNRVRFLNRLVVNRNSLARNKISRLTL